MFFLHNLLPALGYRKSIEIKDDFEREKRGLKKRMIENISDSHIQAHQHHNILPIDFENHYLYSHRSNSN